jgi:hypothetical protein
MIEPGAVFHTGPSDVPPPHPGGRQTDRVGARVLVFPRWAAGADLMFAEAAAWVRPIRFARGAGGHAPVLEVSRLARDAGVRRFVFARIGRPTIRAFDGTM